MSAVRPEPDNDDLPADDLVSEGFVAGYPYQHQPFVTSLKPFEPKLGLITYPMPSASFANRISLLSPTHTPSIGIPINVYLEIITLLQASGQHELSWFSVVREPSSPGDSEYILESVLIFKQEVGGASTDLTKIDAQADIATVATEMIQAGRIDEVNRIKFWGHIHPGDTEPSDKDDETMMEFGNGNTYFIRGIFTRSGQVKFWFYDYQRGLVFEDIAWKILMPDTREREAEILAILAAKVQVTSFVSYPVSTVQVGRSPGKRRIGRWPALRPPPAGKSTDESGHRDNAPLGPDQPDHRS